MTRLLVAVLLALLAGCGGYPRDVEGTLDRVRSGKVVRVGLIAGMDPAADRPAALRFVRQVEATTSARAVVSEDAAERTMAKIESGQLDLAVGPFAKDSPWRDDVSILEPLTERRVGKRTIGLSAVTRNGENAWVMLLEKLVRRAGAGA